MSSTPSRAEDVGKFPDKNLAEALQRVPGVVINREFGEGERVNIRGTDDALTTTLLNGHSLSTADWFILDQLDTTRSFNYLMLPADLIAQAVVYKTSQADLEEGGIGGTVNVITRNPLDLPSSTVFAKLEGAYTELADEFDPNASALVSWKNGEDIARLPARRASTRSATSAATASRCSTYSTTNLGGQRRPGARAHRLGAVPAGARPHGRQLQRAVPAERHDGLQPHGPVFEVRCRQHQRELHGVGHRARSARRHR